MLNDKIVAATVSKVLIFCLWVPLAALAEVTGPLQQDPVTEDMLAEPGGILDRVYGLGNLRRVADRGADWTDQYWSFEGDSTISVRAIAKYTGLSHWFGYLPGPLGSDFTGLINSGDVMFGVYDNDPETVPRVAPPPDSFSRADAGDIFRLGLQVRGASGSGRSAAGPGSGQLWSSFEPENTSIPSLLGDDELDRMVTFEIIARDIEHPNNVVGAYVVAWEDWTAGNRGLWYDGDYDDFVVELIGIRPAAEGDYGRPFLRVSSEEQDSGEDEEWLSGDDLGHAHAGAVYWYGPDRFSSNSAVQPPVGGGSYSGGGGSSGGSSGSNGGSQYQYDVLGDVTPEDPDPVVPEPGGIALLAAGVLAIRRARRDRKVRVAVPR